MPGPAHRFGTGLLGASGLALAGLMAYTLAFEGCGGSDPSPAAADAVPVAVFFPDRGDWSDFRHGVEACVARGLARAVRDDGESLTVATPRLGRAVRFDWRGVRGLGETADEVGRLARADRPPVAVVGSSTSLLTASLAGALRDSGGSSPVLLIPWATALDVLDPATGRAGPLLEIDRDRTFRFCPDNRELAGSVVACLAGQGGGEGPARAFVVVDPRDPYSTDLAACFRAAIGARFPGVAVVERAEALQTPSAHRLPGTPVVPSAAELALADEVWTAAEAEAGSESAPPGRTTWVVLPLQGDPGRRMLAALRRRSSWRGKLGSDGPVRVVCGDGIDRPTLEGLVGLRSFPIWSASAFSTRPGQLGLRDDAQTLAEVAAGLFRIIDDLGPGSAVTAEAIRSGFDRLDLDATDPAAFGRPLAFEPGGERRGEVGRVLAIRPGSPGVLEFAVGPDGLWPRAEDRDPAGAGKGVAP